MLNRFKKDKTGSLLRAARSGNIEKLIVILNKNVNVNACDGSGLTALHLSAKEGYVAVVKELLKRGAKVDVQTKKKNTPLHISSLSGKLESVKMLLDGGANVNAQSMNGFTPLYMASQEGHVEVVRLLVASKADPNLATDDGFTPLSVALQQGHVDVVRFLMEQSSSSKKHSLSALHMAAKTNDAKALKLLLQTDGVDCNRTTRSGFTPLHIASHYGHVDIGLALLQRKADVNASARNGITPLHVASKRGHLLMVKLLISSGADLDSKTMDGMTPLHCASKSGHHQVIRHLLEKGSKVNPKTKHGLTPLHNASQADSAESCKVLLNNKASINEGTVDDLTPLHVAAHFGNVKSGRLLLEKRCDVDARTKAGFTPLHVAIIKKKPRMVELLLRFGANLDAQTATGLSPMHVAAATGSSPIASSLLQSGNVNVNSRTSRGDTPLHLATRNNHLDIVVALLHGGAHVDVKGTDHRLTPLHISSQLGHSESTCLLLKHGSSPDSKTSEMMTPLHLAASKNSLECAAHLLDHGANADVANKSGYTPLHTAIKHNSLEVARLLKDRGVSSEVEGSNGIKPLHVATRYNHLDALQLLLESGALTNCRAHNGYTPLHVAAQENRINIANLLLAQGADVNPVSKAKVTPLHLACKEGNDKFAKLLLDKGAHVNSLTSSSLTPMHYAAISGKPEVAELLESSGADVMSRDNNGNTPLHLACYHGKSTMVAYLLKHGADPNVANQLGMTPLHYSTQNGDLSSVNTLLNNGAEPNTLSNDGWSPLCIAQRNGYGQLATLLLPLTLDKCLYFPDDLEKGGSDVDGVQSFVFSSPYPRPKVLINLDRVDLEPVKELPTDFDDNDLFELDKLEGLGSVTSLGPGASDDDLRYIRDGEEICFSSYAGLKSSEIRTKSPLLSRPMSSLSSRPASPSFNNFLVSFMVDARGGSMYGQRHSGVSVFVPPGCASSPVRVTCRYLAPEKLRHPPPLLPEGEDLACRVIEVGPTGQQFLGPVTLKVPHYASLRDGAREIIIMRSDDGRTWNTHHPPPAQEALAREMDANGILSDDLLDLEKQHVTIVTDKFPVYFALVTRPKRQSENVGSEGGILTSPLNHDVQLVIPQGAVKRDTQVQMQIVDVPEDMVDFEFGGKARVSPIVVIEPKRRKFHTPVTVKIPLPKQKADDDYMVTRLLCSVSGDKVTSKWEDITDKTPLNIINNCAAFLTSISAKYWLVKVRQTSDNWIEKATLVQQGASAVPFLAQFVVLGKRASQREGNFRIFCVTEDRADKIKEAQRNCDFEEITKSQEVEVLQGKPLYLDIDGDLTVARKQQGELHSLIFHSFRENRLPVRARYTDDFLKAWLERGMMDQAKGRFLFHHTPSHLTPVTQAPVCSLEVYMPEGESGDFMCCNVGAESDSLELRSSDNRAEEHISKAELRLTDIADALDTDWIPLALQLGLTPHDVAAIQSDYDFLPEQALVMLHTWVQRYKDKATGNNLEKALKQINKEDVLSRCMYNIRQVTDVHEMAVAKEYLDSSLNAPKDYLGSGADVASSRGSSVQRGVSLDRSYGEHASFKDVSLFDSGSESASLLGKDELGKDKLKTGRGSDRFIYMDGSKSPSNLTVTPSESDVEFLPTADVCELDAGVEYELEEIWDGTRWKYVQNVQKKVKDKPQPKDDHKKTEDSTFASLTVEAASPTGRTTPIVDVSDTDLPGTIQKNVIVDEPDDEASLGSASFRGRKAPTVTDVTDSLEVAISHTETSLASVKEEEHVAEDEDEREKTPIIEVLEDQDYKKTTTDSREEQLEDGTTLRYKTQTVQTVRPVVEKYFSSGRWHEERKELIVGEDIQEEVLELAPGVNVEHGTDLESETTVEEFNETLPNGTWVKRKVSRIKVSRKRSPARITTSPWDEAIITSGRKIPITTLPRDSYKETDVKMATKDVPTSPVNTHVTTGHNISTDAMEKVLTGDIIEEPEIVEHEELLPDGTILHYRTITRKLKRPRTRKVIRDGSIIETVTEHELVATTVEDEITEVSVDAQKLERPETAEKSIVSIEEFEEQMPDKSLLKRKIIRSSLKLHPSATTTSQATATIKTDIPAKDNLSRSTEHKISEAQFLKTTEQVEACRTTTTHQTQQIQQMQQTQTQQIQQMQQTQTQQIQQTSQTSIREVPKQPDVQEPSKSIESEFKHTEQESITPMPPSKVQQFKVVEKSPELAGRERITETQTPSAAESKVRKVHEEPVAITELSPEEETVNILTPIESPVTPQAIFKFKPSKDHQETSDVPKRESPVAPKKGATFLHISPVPVMPVGQTTVLSSPSSPTSGPYELPPITETLGVQEWEDIKSDGTRQCFKIVTKRKMRPIAIMRPSMDGNSFIEKIIKKEKIGVEIDEEITEIAPNVVLDEEDDLDKTTSIDEFHETASDGTWVKRKVRRTEIKKSEDVEEYVSEESASSAEQEELAMEQFYEQEQSLDEKRTTSLTERLEQSEDHRETVRSSESLPIPLPRTKNQDIDSKTWTAQTLSEATESTSLFSQLHHRPGGLVEEMVDPVLGRITVVTFADQPRVDEREETDSTGGTLRYKILTRNFKKKTFKMFDDGSERLIREENFGTEVEEHIEEIEAGLKGDDEVGVERKTSEHEFNETMPDGTWLKRKVSHAKIYRKRRDDYTQRLPTPVRSPKIGSKFAHALEQVTEPKFDEREEVTSDGTKLKFKVTSRDHVVRSGSDWKRLGTEITEEIVEISPEVIHDDDEFTDKVTTVSETEDVLEDGTWIKRKIVHVKVTKRRFKADNKHKHEASARSLEAETQPAEQPIVQHALPVTSKAPDDSEFTEVVNVEEHEELGENGSLVTYKKTTKKCLKPVTEKIVTDGDIVERVSHEMELGTLILEETVEYEPGLVPDFMDYTDEENEKIHVWAVCEESSKLLPDNTWLKKRHVVTNVEWKKDQPGKAAVCLDEVPQTVEVKQQTQTETPADQMRELSTLPGQIVTSHKEQTFSTTAKTLSSEQVLTTQDVNLLERTELSKSIAAQPSEAKSFLTASGEYKQLIKLPTKAAEKTPVEIKMSGQSMDRKDDQFVKEESVEETDLDEIFDEVSKMENERMIQVKRKDDKVQTTILESDSKATQSTTTVTETEIISQSTESKEITVRTSTADEVKADHKKTVVVSSPVSALIRPDEAKPTQEQVDVVAVDGKEKSNQIVVPETSPTELSKLATEKVKEISIRSEKDEISVLRESEILSSDKPAEDKVPQKETAKPQHVEEYTFGVEEEDREDVKTVIEGKILDQSTVEPSADENQPSIKTIDQSLQLKETKYVVEKDEISEVKNRQDEKEVVASQTADVFETRGNKDALEGFSIEITDSNVLTQTDSRVQTSEIVVDSRSTGDSTSSVIQVDVVKPQVVKSETEESETVILDKQATFILEEQETEKVTRTEIAEIPLTVTEGQTSVDSYTVASKSTVTESKQVESVQTTTAVKSTLSEIETSKVEVEMLEIPSKEVEAKLFKEENLEQIPRALSEQTGTQEAVSESISTTDLKMTTIVEHSSKEISSETSVSEVTIEKDTVVISKPKESAEFQNTTDVTKPGHTRLDEATVQSEGSVKPSTEMKPQTEERSAEEVVVSDKVEIEVLEQPHRVTEEKKLENTVVLKKQAKPTQSLEAKNEKESKVERSESTDDSLVSKTVEESTEQVLETKEFAVTKKESVTLKVVTVEETQAETTNTELIAGNSTQEPIGKMSENEAKIDQQMQLVETRSETIENVKTSDLIKETKVDEVSLVESKAELTSNELREKETQPKLTTDETYPHLQQPHTKPETLQTVDVTKKAEELLTKVEKIQTIKEDVTESPVVFVPHEEKPKVTEESKPTLSTEEQPLEESPAKVELELPETVEKSRTKNESQTSEEINDIVPTVEAPKTTEKQKPEEPEVIEENKPKEHKDESLKPVEDFKTLVQDAQTTIQTVPGHYQTEVAKEKESEKPKTTELRELQTSEATPEAKDLLKTSEKQEIADQSSATESTVEERIEIVKKPSRREISAFRERTTARPQLQQQSKSDNVEEITNEELYTSPIDDSFTEKLRQFQTSPDIAAESLSFGFTPVQEQPEILEKVKEPLKPSVIEHPHLDFSSADVSPTDSEKDFQQSLTKEKLESYEKVLTSLQQVLEGGETETKNKAPLALVKAMLCKTKSYSDKESPTEKESLEVETPVEKPQMTSVASLFKNFLSETELNDSSAETLLDETKVLPEKVTSHSEPGHLSDVTPQTNDLLKSLEKQEIADQPSESESTVAEERIEIVKKPTRTEISAFRERTTACPQLQQQSKSDNVEEITNEELYTSPIDDSFTEKLRQFQTPPDIAAESLSFGFTPVQEQPDILEKVKEPPKPSVIEHPHLDFSSAEVSPTDSEKHFQQSLTKEKLESYEKVLTSLEQVLEGGETETKNKAPLALVKAMLCKTKSYSDKESPTEQESLEVETPVEKSQMTSVASLFKKFFSETELNDSMAETLLDETKVLPEKVTSHSEPGLLVDVTRKATSLAEEMSCSIVKYFEASGNLLEEKILSVEEGDSKATKAVHKEETVLEKQSEDFLDGLTGSVIEHFQLDQTIKQEAKDSSTTTSQSQPVKVTNEQTLGADGQSTSMVIIPHDVAKFPVKLVEILKGPSTADAKDDRDRKIEEEKLGKDDETKECVERTVIEILESSNKDSTEHAVTTVTQIELVNRDVEKTHLTLKEEPPVATEKCPVESKVDQKTTETVVERFEHVVEKETTIEKKETQEEITVQEVSVSKKLETEFKSELDANVDSQVSLKKPDKVETVGKEIQQTNVTAETTKVEELKVVSEETFAEESKTERTVVKESSEETVKEDQLKRDFEKDDSIGIVSVESANLSPERITRDETKAMETTTKEVKTDEALKKVVEEVELATTRSKEKSAEKSTENIKSESQTLNFEESSTATVEVITEKSEMSVRSEQVKSIDDSQEPSTETKKIKMVSAEIADDQSRKESSDDLASSTVIDIIKTTISTAVATEASAATSVDVTTTIVSTTTTTTTSTSVSSSLPTALAKKEPFSTQQYTESKEVLKTESSDTVTLSKTLETEQNLEEYQPAVQTSVESELPSMKRTNEEEEGVTIETVEGDVRCKVDESENYELSEDGKKSITKKVMTRNYYQTHICNKVKDGVIIAVQPVETFVGKCVDECIFESATDISDPYAADVETTTSIDESEETLDDGTWVKKKTTTVVAYLAHEELDSPSIFLEAVTLPKSPKPAVEEQSQVQKEILESFGSTFPEFIQRTENIDNVKMRIIRLPDSRPKIQESRKSSGSKATRHSSKQAEQQSATSPTSTSKVESRTKREGKPPSFVLPEARSTRTTPPSRTQTDVMSTTSTGSKRLLRSRVRRTITRKIRKVLHSGEVIEDVVTEEVPDVEMSETSSVRSGQSDAFDFMSPMSSSVASIASPSDIASPRRRKGSASSHSSLRVYTDTVEGQPEVTTDVQEREETLPDGRVIVRKVIKTKQKQTIVKRVVLEAEEGQPGEADIAALIGEDDPSIRMYADSLLQEVDSSRRSTPGTQGQSSYVDEWLQQAVAASGEAPPATGFEQPSTGPVVVSRVHSAVSSKPKYRVSMERTDATTSASSAAEEQLK